jgi:septation ring formation regulator EzrA
MAEQLTTEERLSRLESDVAELQHAKREQENRDIALLARVDGFIDDLRRVERTQMRAFDELRAGQQEQKTAIERLNEGQQELQTGLTGLAGQVRGLAAGQQQILEILLGNPPRNN